MASPIFKTKGTACLQLGWSRLQDVHPYQPKSLALVRPVRASVGERDASIILRPMTSHRKQSNWPKVHSRIQLIQVLEVASKWRWLIPLSAINKAV